MLHFTSSYFPGVDIPALEKFACAAAAAEHAYRVSRNTSMARLATRGKGKARAQDQSQLSPKVADMQDAIWAGEKVILIGVAPESAPLGPHQIIAYFPRGRPTFTTKAMVGMTQLARESAQVGTPKIYGYYDNPENPIRAEVVLLEMVQGDNLADIFPTLSSKQIVTVCARLGDTLVKLFACRKSFIGSETNVPDSPPRSSKESPAHHASVLLSWPFNEGPLAGMPPQEAVTSTHDYLLALSKRPERMFGESSPSAAQGDRRLNWTGTPPLKGEDIIVIRDTWNRLGSLISYHSGGFYIPGALSPEARYAAYSVLQSKSYGIRHADLSLSRIFVRWTKPGDEDSDVTLVLAGWEHAFYAPLWSCARMPPWLMPHIHPYEALSWESQRTLRALIFKTTTDSRHPQAKEWIVAHAYGETERWFEGMLSSHWSFRDTNELLLIRLRAHWMRERPDVPFPLRVGGPYISRISPLAQHRLHSSKFALPLSDEGRAKEQKFMKEVRIAMNALAIQDTTHSNVNFSWPQYPVDDVD